MGGFWFLAKKIVARLCFPVMLVGGVLLAGCLLWRRRPASPWGPRLVLAGVALFLLLSLPAVGWLCLRPLELLAGPPADPAALAQRGVREVVVLSGWMDVAGWPPAERLAAGSLRRVCEGVRLWRGLPRGARLVLSGGDFHGSEGEGPVMAALARELGVPGEALLVEAGSWDTADQAAALAPLLAERPFALVSSASHLPRALWLMRAQGLAPLPAPADFATKSSPPPTRAHPPGQGLSLCERAFYEYLGLAWTFLRTR